jgi:hypothetical protein
MSHVSVPRGRVAELAAALPIRTSGSARIAGLATTTFALLAALASAQSAGPKVELLDGRGRPVASLQAGDTVMVQASGLTAKRPYDLVLTTGSGELVGFARTTADLGGALGPEVLWYDSGITGPDPAGNGQTGSGFKTLHEAELYLLAHPLTVEVREEDVANPGGGALVVSAPAPMQAPRSTPWLEFTDLQGRHRNAFESGRDVMCVSGSGFAPGSTVKLFVTTDRTDWNDGDAFEDVTGFNGRPNPDTIQLGPTDTSFTVPVWPAVYQHEGRFDLIGRVVGSGGAGTTNLLPTDLLAHGIETGIHVTAAPNFAPGSKNPDLVRNLAGRRTIKKDYPGFEYQDTFLRHTAVLAALDPSDVPSGHPGGAFGMFYVVRSKSVTEWRQDPTLHDITEGVEVRPIKPGTLELTIGQVWADADPAGVESSPCDLVIDVAQGPQPPAGPPFSGTGTGGSSGGTSRVFDGVYDPGIDFIDGLGGDGLYIVDDPSDPGPYPVGRVDYDFPDAYDCPWGHYADKNVDVRATVTYPGQTTGTNVPVFGTNQQYPIVFILHGNHIICLTGCNWNCSKAQRVPNWRGYDYLLDLWASHGFIAVSIDGFDLTCNDDRFVERAALILEHIRYWEDWNNPAIPDTTWNGRFWNRVDVTRVGVAGHSRGGEGAAGSVQINQDMALGHQIKACITIAPTDFNSWAPPGGGSVEFLVRDTPLFNIMGSNDGDVWDDEGAQIFDRAAPPKHRASKSQAFIYGAEHNSWNTVWVDPAWGGGDDDPGGPGSLTHQQQQDTASVYMTTWWMAWLQDRKEMLAFHKGRLDSPKLAGVVKTYWTYEDASRIDVDNFEDKPADPTKNSLGGTVTVSPTPLTYQESSFLPGAYDGSFFQQTNGLVVGWNVTTTYESDIPAANQDVSSWSHLHIRATQIWDNVTLNKGGNQSFLVDLVDANGVSQSVDVSTEAFAPIPVSYRAAIGPRKSMLSSIRVPLRSFTQDNSKLDLTQITKIVITFQSTGLLGIDDIQFTK